MLTTYELEEKKNHVCIKKPLKITGNITKYITEDKILLGSR